MKEWLYVNNGISYLLLWKDQGGYKYLASLVIRRRNVGRLRSSPLQRAEDWGWHRFCRLNILYDMVFFVLADMLDKPARCTSSVAATSCERNILRLFSSFLHLTFNPRKYCGGPVNSTFRSRLRAVSNFFSTSGSIEK